MPKRKSKLRLLEYLFLLAGLGAIDYCIWVNVESNFSQIQDNRKFERSLHEGSQQQPHARAPRHFAKDELVGRLEIPRLNIRVMVHEGDDAATLRHAAGHIPSTAFPGDPGNVAFAAHRDTFFRPLRNIKKDDKILVTTQDGNYEYVVQSTAIVSPSDVSVLESSTSHELTLVTCYPFYYIGSAPHRFIVHASQVAASEPSQQARSSLLSPGESLPRTR